MKKQTIFLLILFLFRMPFLSATDEKKVTLTTYYPAPYGDYKTLKASESITVTGPSGATATNAVLNAGGYSGTGLVVTNANKVGIGTKTPAGILDLTSTSQAFFPPRVTTSQRNAIASVTTAETSKKGAVVYNTDTGTLETYDGNKNWKSVGGGGFVWKTIAKKSGQTYPQLPWSDYISQKPTGTCICSDYSDPSSTPKFVGYLARQESWTYATCDEDTYSGCKKSYMHYLAPE